MTKYDAAMMVEARRLAAAGWGARAIADILEREVGTRPPKSTVYNWINPEKTDVRNRVNRDAKRRKRAAAGDGKLRSNHQTNEFRVARIHALRRVGLSKDAIAKVMTLDFPETALTRAQVDGVLRADRTPRCFKAVA